MNVFRFSIVVFLLFCLLYKVSACQSDYDCALWNHCSNNSCVFNGECTNDASCTASLNSSFYCDSSSVCYQRKAQDNFCSRDYECLSNKCIKTGGNPYAVCKYPGFCFDAGNCNASQYCLNYSCVQKKSGGSGCNQSSECLSGNCFNYSCGYLSCSSNTDCGNNEYCSESHFCTTKKNNNEFCQQAVECFSGFCLRNLCVLEGFCVGDEDCNNSAFCNYSVCSPKHNTSDVCSNDNQCLSGFCNNGICVNKTCVNSSFCGERYYCENGFCKPQKDNLQPCSLNEECLSSYCFRNFICRPIDFCQVDEDCKQGEDCVAGRCSVFSSCKNDHDCSNTQYCSPTTMSCEDRLEDGFGCDKNNMCLGGHCNNGICSSKYTCYVNSDSLLDAAILNKNCKVIKLNGDINYGSERGLLIFNFSKKTLDCQHNTITLHNITIRYGTTSDDCDGNSDDMTIKNCFFNLYATNTPFLEFQAFPTRTFHNILIENNKFTLYGNSTNASIYFYHIDNLTFTSNSVFRTSFASNAIYFLGHLSDTSTFKNNNFCGSKDYPFDNIYFLPLSSFNDLKISKTACRSTNNPDINDLGCTCNCEGYTSYCDTDYDSYVLFVLKDWTHNFTDATNSKQPRLTLKKNGLIFLQDMYFEISNEIGYLPIYIKEDKFDVVVSNIDNQTFTVTGVSTLKGREITIEINPNFNIPMPTLFGGYTPWFNKTTNHTSNVSTVCFNFVCEGACALNFHNVIFAVYQLINKNYVMVYYNVSDKDTMCYSVNTTGEFFLKACVNTSNGVQSSCVSDTWYPFPSQQQFFCLLPSSLFGFQHLIQFVFMGLITFLLFFAFTKIDVGVGLVVISLINLFICLFNLFCLPSEYITLFYALSGICLLFAGLIFASRRNWI